ncbi:HMG-Y-related protein A [Spatholobus suberectus]|nr:HMG-Y-related protein A [Spatholobus suberectus]
MATEEVNKPLSLPPCPEMIMKALEALNEPSGSSKSAISKHIESTYGTVLSPPRPRGRPPKDPNAPPKSPRLRGPLEVAGQGEGQRRFARSPAVAAPTAVSTGRPRGRPPKVKPQLQKTSTVMIIDIYDELCKIAFPSILDVAQFIFNPARVSGQDSLPDLISMTIMLFIDYNVRKSSNICINLEQKMITEQRLNIPKTGTEPPKPLFETIEELQQ